MLEQLKWWSDSMVHLGNDWDEILAGEFEQDYYKRIRYWLKKGNTPSRPSIRRQRTSLTLCGTRRIPRSRPSFSGRTRITVPDRRTDFASRFSQVFSRLRACRTSSRRSPTIPGTPIPASGNLDRWAEQGVLLLNSVLTVREHEAASHAGRGWETFTDAVVRAIAERKEGIVYMLWGSYAQKKGAIADPQRNLILKAVHPSPLSVYRGFFGCRHFSRANDYLRSIGKEPIVW